MASTGEMGTGDVSTVGVADGIGIIRIDSPPVNALGIAVRRAIADGVQALEQDAAARAIVLICGGRTFFAGADITEFGKPFVQPDLGAVCDLLEGSTKPIVAAIHGTALGGGLEVALACDYRIAVPSAKLGLPEVALGLLPGAGGTQRLPRLVGAEAALDAITSGRPMPAKQALAAGVLDALITEGQLEEEALAFARGLLADGKGKRRVRDLDDTLAPARGKPDLFADYLKQNARAFRGFKAPAAIVQAVEAAVELPFDQGMARERELFAGLMSSTESQAQRHYFFAERQTTKVPDVPPATPTLPIAHVGVIGAGTMGGGITMNFLNVGIPVTLVEMSQAALDRGLGVIRRNYENTAKKGRMTAEQVEQRMALVTPRLGLEALADVDLVIEAVFEQMAVKQDIFGKLDTICKPGAILASNTSYLDVDTIAAATQRPEWVLGLHFFSPANVMRLLEVVRGAKTAKEVIATGLALAKKIAKVPVLSRVGHGFIANRVMEPYMQQSNQIILEGPTPQEVDKALFDYGFAMGPLQMFDLVGLDVIGRDNPERTVRGDLVALDRLGQKKNGGFYDYDEARRPIPSPVATEVIAAFSRDMNIPNGGPRSAEEIVARLLYPVVNEGAKVLDEGIAMRASDIDVACILGYNWPVYTGGPMFWADTVGLPKIVAGLRALAAAHGDRFAPSPYLEKLAETGGSFTR